MAVSGERVKLYTGKTGGGGGGGGTGEAKARERFLSPFPPLVSPRLFFFGFPREFFSRALLSERLEQATIS